MSYTPGPLPFPPLCRDDTRHDEDYYTASQVQAYAASEVARAVAAERERCAKLCEQADDDGEGPDCWGWHAKDYAKAIRSDPQRLQVNGE